MKFLQFFITTSVAEKYIFDYSNGVLFQENPPVYIYDASIPIDINVMLDSPREKFRNSIQADCGEDYLIEEFQNNFFGRNDSNFNQSTEDCLTAFRTFDQAFISFMGEDLIFTRTHNLTNYKRRSENMNKATKDLLENYPTFEEWQKENEEKAKKRNRRAAPIAVGAGVAIAATGGYSIYVDAKSRARDALLADEIELERQRISILEDVVETTNLKMDEAVKRIRKSKRPIISYGGLMIPNDAKAVQKILEGADQEINQYFAAQSGSMAKEITEAILTLQNHRLPLNPVFLDAIKAQCIVYQSAVSEEQAKRFCTEFSFHSSRWDTKLRFQGYGLTTWNRKDGADQNKENLEIRQIVLSIRIEIPRMKLIAQKFTSKNLGYFKDDGSRWMIDVPQHIVVMPSKEALEMRPADCLRFTPSFSCSAVSLAPNQCAESILLHNSTRYCQTREIDARKCGYFEDPTRAFVSMREPGTAQWFHHAPSERVNKIDSFLKTKFTGALNCGPAILRISAAIPSRKTPATSNIHYIQPIQIRMRSLQDDELEQMNLKIAENLQTVKTMGDQMLEMNLTTLELMRRTAKTESNNAAESAKDFIFKNFIAPLIGSIGSLAFIILALAAVYVTIKLRRKKQRIVIKNFEPPKSTNRTDTL